MRQDIMGQFILQGGICVLWLWKKVLCGSRCLIETNTVRYKTIENVHTRIFGFVPLRTAHVTDRTATKRLYISIQSLS